MSVEPQEEVRIESESDIVLARRKVRELATTLGFQVTDVTRIITATSELARNVFIHAGTGSMHHRSLTADQKIGIELTFEDSGPGIADLEQAMQEGYSTAGGLGIGLPGTKRLMDEMEIESEAGKGTRVTIRKWLGRR